MRKEGKVTCDVCKRRLGCDERYYHVIAVGPQAWETGGHNLCEACWQKVCRFLWGVPTPNDEIEHYTPDVTTWPYLDSTTQPTTTTTTPVWLGEHIQPELLARAIALLDELREIIQQLQRRG